MTKFSSPDDRPEYASLRAILYGPYLLAGYSGNGDWEINESAKSISDWISPIPASYNSQLVTLSRHSRHKRYVLSNKNQSITMERQTKSGTDCAVHATFRLILIDNSSSEFSSLNDYIGKSVMLEPFDSPGMLVVQGTHNELVVTDSSSDQDSSVFRLVSGLDERDGTVSLESVRHKDCFVSTGEHFKTGKRLKLSCKNESSEEEFNNHKASFVMEKGMAEYHPISFVAKGKERNFLLVPIFSFRDESYTVYFNIPA